MYKIYADETLIYDSTIEDYKIVKGSITLEINKSGSFTFAIYPDHFHYDRFVKLKTVITVYKSGKIVFRGRILNDVSDYRNNKVITCEGEMGFLQDSIIRPFSFNGTPEALFKKFIDEHNAQVDDFKKFKIGSVTVIDANNYIARSNTAYESAYKNLNSRLIEDSLGGYFYITHGEDGTEITPTLNYLADFTKISAQKVEFGSNLKDYTKTVKAEEIATAIIPLGATVDDGDSETEDPKLTIASVNDGKDYIYDEDAVMLYGWITKVVDWDDVTEASNLLTKARTYLNEIVKQNITIELNIVDLHLIDPSIESINVCEYVRVTSAPHNFDSTLLCNKQTIDLLKPENDSLVLGYSYYTFTEQTTKTSAQISTVVKSVNYVDKTASGALDAIKVTNQEFNNFKTQYMDAIYPIGSIYMSVKNVNPGTLFGGSWESWGSGRVPVGVNASDDNFNTVEKTGGESTHTLTTDQLPSHSHGLNDHTHSIPSLSGTTSNGGEHTHNHANGNSSGFASFNDSTGSTGVGVGTSYSYQVGYSKATDSAGAHEHTITTDESTTGKASGDTASAGSGSAHNNLQPYITCYMWKRTA